MAGKVRNLRRRNGRYAARQVVPKELVSIIGKTELLIDLGLDRRRALERHPAALARLKHNIAVARHKINLNAGRPFPAFVDPRSPQETSAYNYFERLEQDEVGRDSHHQYAQVPIDELYVQAAEYGAQGWRELARLLCHSESEAMERVAERDEGDFSGRSSNPNICSS